MGKLRITEKGLKLEGASEFLEPLYAKEIQSKPEYQGTEQRKERRNDEMAALEHNTLSLLRANKVIHLKLLTENNGRPLFLQSSRNVSVNIVNSKNQLLTQLVTGSSGFKAKGKLFEVKSTSGKLLFSADEQEVVVGAERLRVMGLTESEFITVTHLSKVLLLAKGDTEAGKKTAEERERQLEEILPALPMYETAAVQLTGSEPLD
ncbi:hypothetical protein NQZ68_032179 [Dissostichus eleginoides]|nr:hypothetical protein NQZ68_032179 [Dissostichus eleginoides]